MKAIVFAAGLGTRLRPMTNTVPKALVEVKGQTMLKHVIDHLKHHNVTEIVINVHHLADKIESYLKANSGFGMNIHISDERQLLLDTGGAILKARKWLDGTEPFLIYNADVLTDVDLTAMADHHIKTDADATLLVNERATTRYIMMNSDELMQGWINIQSGDIKPAGLSIPGLHPMAFSGLHIMSPRMLDSLAEYGASDPVFSIMSFYIDTCSRHRYMGFKSPTPYQWYDIGKITTLQAAEQNFKPYDSNVTSD